MSQGQFWTPITPKPGSIFHAEAQRFSRWAQKGVWERVFKTLADDPDNEYAMIDATIVRAHQHSAGARKKGASTKP
jgi:transposase